MRWEMETTTKICKETNICFNLVLRGVLAEKVNMTKERQTSQTMKPYCSNTNKTNGSIDSWCLVLMPRSSKLRMSIPPLLLLRNLIRATSSSTVESKVNTVTITQLPWELRVLKSLHLTISIPQRRPKRIAPSYIKVTCWGPISKILSSSFRWWKT